MVRPVNLTAFGSCRVVTPCSILKLQGRAGFNQDNIFGFVHNSLEILQQFQLICGAVQAPQRLRGFLNIPGHWKAPAPIEATALKEQFRAKFIDTDLFIVEVSSIRVIQFKAFFLQIHRTREILLRGGASDMWWQNLVRYGKNEVEVLADRLSDPVHLEVVRGITSYEQTTQEVLRNLIKIVHFLPKPVLFVSTFNTDYHGRPVPQRSVLADALMRATSEVACGFFDPTRAVLERGLNDAILDLGHYRPEFEPEIAGLLLQEAEKVLCRSPKGSPTDV